MPQKMKRRTPRLSHLDALGNIEFARQLEEIRTKTYEMRFPQFMARKLIPVNNGTNPGVNVITWRLYSPVGMARIISNYADDLPRADVQGEENSSKVYSIGNSYGWNIDEIAGSVYAGTQLDTRKANAARRANEERVESLAAVGDTRYNIKGLTNQPNATLVTAPAGASTYTDWKRKTSDEVLADLVALKQTPINLTKGIERIDTIVLPEAQHGDISTRRISTVSDTTVLEYFQRTNTGIEVMPWERLAGAGASGVDRAIGYNRNPDNLELNIPKEWTELDPQERNLEVVIPCHSRFGGVIVFWPLTMIYMDGI